MGTLCAQSAHQRDHRQEEERGEDEEHHHALLGTAVRAGGEGEFA
jgi:hypothetical protein